MSLRLIARSQAATLSTGPLAPTAASNLVSSVHQPQSSPSLSLNGLTPAGLAAPKPAFPAAAVAPAGPSTHAVIHHPDPPGPVIRGPCHGSPACARLPRFPTERATRSKPPCFPPSWYPVSGECPVRAWNPKSVQVVQGPAYSWGFSLSSSRPSTTNEIDPIRYRPLAHYRTFFLSLLPPPIHYHHLVFIIACRRLLHFLDLLFASLSTSSRRSHYPTISRASELSRSFAPFGRSPFIAPLSLTRTADSPDFGHAYLDLLEIQFASVPAPKLSPRRTRAPSYPESSSCGSQTTAQTSLPQSGQVISEISTGT